MSKFLGPIHFWLHRKIQIHDALEVQWLEQVISNHALPHPLLNTLDQLDRQFGAPAPYESLENAIDTDNIHGWLAQRIGNSETRFAAKLTGLTNQLGSTPLDIAIRLYADFGETCGREASETYDHTLPTAFKLLNNYILEGMPCDNASAIVDQSETQFTWKSTRCLHQNYWTQIGGNVTHYLQLRDAFNASFFKALDGLTYTRLQHENETHYTIGGTQNE